MCIITDENNIVVSISLIPGLKPIPMGWSMYFPVSCKGINIGDSYFLGVDDGN